MREASRMITSVAVGPSLPLKGGIQAVFSMVYSMVMGNFTGKTVVNIEGTTVVA